MAYKVLTLLLTLTLTTAVFANPTELIVKETVGVTPIKGIAYAPETIVMEDHLIVFYQLNNGTNAYYIASGVGTGENEGQLIWEEQGTIPATRFNTTRFSPTPVLVDGRLYLFGRHHIDDVPRIIYNSVANLSDLKNSVWNIPHEIKNGDEKIVMGKNLHHLSVIDYQQGLLLAYYQKEAKNRFSYSICNPDANAALVCDGSEVNYGGSEKKKLFDGQPLLSRSATSVFLYLRNLNGDLTRNTLTEAGWQVEDPYQQINLSDAKIGAAVDHAVLNESRYIYFRKSGDDLIKRTKVHTDGNFDEIITVKDGSNKTIKTNSGVKTIIYRGRIYNFYLDKNNAGALSYFSDAESHSDFGAHPGGAAKLNYTRSSTTPYGTPSGIFYLGAHAKSEVLTMPASCSGGAMHATFAIADGNVVLNTSFEGSSKPDRIYWHLFNPNLVYTLYPGAYYNISWYDDYCNDVKFTLNQHAKETTGPTITSLPNQELNVHQACIHGHPSGFGKYYKALYAGSETGVIAIGGNYYWGNATFQGEGWNAVPEGNISCY